MLKTFPAGVQDEVGLRPVPGAARREARSAKPLKGLGPGVLEVVSDHRGDTFRAVYTVRLADRAFVLHAFQKKSTHGIVTPPSEIALIKQRPKLAMEINEEE